MRKLRKQSYKISTVLCTKINNEWHNIWCPLQESQPCGEWCAWYSEASNSIYTNQLTTPGHEEIVVVRCKCEPIGELIPTEKEAS